VRDPVRDKLAFRFEDLGEVAAKNIARPIHVFRVRHDIESTQDKRVFPRVKRRIVIAAASLLVLVGVGAGTRFWHGHAPASAPPPLSLVVLPFDNLSGDPNKDYLVDAITDDLTTDLSHIPEAFVIAGASARAYKGKAVDARQIGRELGVRYVIEGSVRLAGTALHLNVQLISTETGAHVWSDMFEASVKDLALAQDAILARMRGTLGISLIETEIARKRRSP